jgi:hypothetical protein
MRWIVAKAEARDFRHARFYDRPGSGDDRFAYYTLLELRRPDSGPIWGRGVTPKPDHVPW